MGGGGGGGTPKWTSQQSSSSGLQYTQARQCSQVVLENPDFKRSPKCSTQDKPSSVFTILREEGGGGRKEREKRGGDGGGNGGGTCHTMPHVFSAPLLPPPPPPPPPPLLHCSVVTPVPWTPTHTPPPAVSHRDLVNSPPSSFVCSTRTHLADLILSQRIRCFTADHLRNVSHRTPTPDKSNTAGISFKKRFEHFPFLSNGIIGWSAFCAYHGRLRLKPGITTKPSLMAPAGSGGNFAVAGPRLTPR
jgi:hypothetical protein